MTGRILAVSYFFPPILSARSIQVAKFVKHLGKFGYSVYVVTTGSDFYKRYLVDSYLSDYVSSSDLHVLRVGANYYGKYIDEFFGRLSGLPFLSWARDAVRVCVRAFDAVYFDYLCTFSNPLDSHIVGFQVKRRYRDIKWIAHFSDPILYNPFVAQHARILKTAVQRITERLVIENADSCYFISDEIMNRVMSRYPDRWRAKCSVLPHCFDSDISQTRSNRASERITIRYIGEYCHNRSLQPVVDALQRLQQRDASILARLKIDIVGQPLHEYIRQGNILEESGVLNFVGSVSYKQSLTLMRDADYLLVVDAPFENSPYFPSKISDYIGAGRPIIGITPFDSCTARILLDLGHTVIAPNNIEEISQFLVDIAVGHTIKRRRSVVSRNQYSCKRIVRKFISEL